MGLMDILNGMQNGPRGQRDPNAGGGGMSPITMAILGLLAYKAVKGLSGSQQPAGQAAPGAPAPAPTQAGQSGGLGDLLGSGGGLGGLLNAGLGGLLGGAAGGALGGSTGGALTNSLNDILSQFQQNGHGETANSWVGTGPNKAISPDDLASMIGADQIDAMVAQTGMQRSDLLNDISEHLPQIVDELTPAGRLPTESEASRFA
jgi:uncharacterized protein YidB (DUF937 family)